MSSFSDYDVLKQPMTEGEIAAFVRRLAQQQIEFQDFESHYSQLNNVKNQLERKLKSKVFTNYNYFIDTAKEMKKLDKDTKNIRDVLSEQSHMLSQLNNALTKVAKSDLFNIQFETSSANSVNSRLNTEVSGLNLPNNDGRTLVSENTVDEIDLHTSRPRQKLCVFMLSDGILTTRFTPNIKNNFQSCKLICVEFYLFNSVSIEQQANKNVVKAIVYPEPVLLQFDSTEEMKQWVDLFNQSKKRAQMNQGALMSSSARSTSSNWNVSTDSGMMRSPSSSINRNSLNTNADLCIYDIPAHLDVSIALKDYDACLNYLREATDFFEENEALLLDSSDTSMVAKVRDSIDEKRNLLISTLREELSIDSDENDCNPNSSNVFKSTSRLINMPGSFGKRVGQLKAASALTSLGFTNEACHLFLKSTSMNMRRILQQKLALSLESLSSVSKFFFNILNLAAKDFQKMFSHEPALFSCLSVWARDEVSFFCEQIADHFNRNNLTLDLTRLSLLVKAVMDESLAVLEETGLELALFLEIGIDPLIEHCTTQIINLVKQTLQEKSENVASWDCIRFEESGNPSTTQLPSNSHSTSSEQTSNADQLTLFLKSMEDIGIDLFSLVADDDLGSVAVCPISIYYFRLIMTLCEDLASISKFGNQATSINALHDLVALYIDLLSKKLSTLDENSENIDFEKNLLLLQLEFFRDSVLKTIAQKFLDYCEGQHEIDFEYEVVRITTLCSTLNEGESSEDVAATNGVDNSDSESYYDRRRTRRTELDEETEISHI